MTMRPVISISPSVSRIFSTAAPSAASRSPRPIQRDAAKAALSVTLTKSSELTMPGVYKGTCTIPLRKFAVSAHVHAPQSAARNALLGDLQSAGPLLFALVGLAGFTLGFFGWVGYVVPRHDGILN